LKERSLSLFEPARLRSVKLRMRRFRRLRSAWHFLGRLRAYRLERGPDIRAEMARQYSGGPDPWRYASSPDERLRYRLALEIIDRWRGDHRPKAFEVGCGEGLFTVELAPRCASVLAVDMNEVALERARVRCAEFDSVRVARWDATNDEPPGRFELVLCMDVMDVGWGPLAQRRAIRKVSRALAPGGVLLVTSVLKSPVVERAQWARWLGAGARGTVNRFAALDTRLLLVEATTTPVHFIALLEAVAEDPLLN
jgi:SAM-dependent methyltransferase